MSLKMSTILLKVNENIWTTFRPCNEENLAFVSHWLCRFWFTYSNENSNQLCEVICGQHYKNSPVFHRRFGRQAFTEIALWGEC